ncbi:MAG: TIGR03986 family CRISPR-associated RAMP protein [Thiomicrospira sp.]
MAAITSPYNFVPMAETVHIPSWQGISQDMPVQDTLSGIIEYELKNVTPLMVGDKRIEDEKGGIVEFFKTPDDHYAIPGTSIKGMIRNWLEIATHSRLSIINDNWLSYRDLRNNEYTGLLTEQVGGAYKAKSQAGWLRFESGEWQLYPAQSWRIENSEIESVFKIAIKDKEAEKIYEKLKGIQSVNFDAEEEKIHSNHTVPMMYAAARNLKKADIKSAKGFLIVTGQMPGPKKNEPGKSKGKHMNFIFSCPSEQPMAYENQNVIKGFLDINKEKADFNYLKALNHPYGIPVFYIQTEHKVSQIGMAQMFRFPYKYSVGQLRYATHISSSDKPKDFAQILFGEIDENGNSNSLKGRVSFSLAKAIGQPTTQQLPSTVLGAPRNSFYPAYINQHELKGRYSTYNQKEAKISGFKRYAVHKSFSASGLPKPPENKGKVNYKVAVQIKALSENQRFNGKVRFHNLNNVELGALLYALSLGGQEGLYHQLGMGKPYGLGKVSFESINLSLIQKENIEKQLYIDYFLQYVENETNSTQTLNQLLVMQNENSFAEGELKYLAFPTGFVETVKSSGKNKLPPLSAKAADLAKKIELEKAERVRQQKIKEAHQAQQDKLNQKSVAQSLVDTELGGEINKQAINTLSELPNLWQDLKDYDQQELANKIKISDYYKNANTKLRKKIRQALGDLAKRIV